MTKIEELEEKLDNAVEKFRLEMNECKAELEKLKENKKEVSNKWKPKLREEYWFRDVYGAIDWCKNGDQDSIDWQYNNIPLFPTKEECEKYWKFRDAVKEKSYEFSEEEWEDLSVKKYIIFYDCVNEIIETVGQSDVKSFGEVHFKTREDAQYIIDNYKEELMTYWL